MIELIDIEKPMGLKIRIVCMPANLSICMIHFYSVCYLFCIYMLESFFSLQKYPSAYLLLKLSQVLDQAFRKLNQLSAYFFHHFEEYVTV
ncbi:hypothetical protein BH11BAC3_BH11BAC3_40710 [soil metagenome]